MCAVWMILVLALGGAKDSKLEWHTASIVDAQQAHYSEGPGMTAGPMNTAGVNLSRDQVDLDDGEAVWVAVRTVVRSRSWRPGFGMKVQFAVEGKKIYIRGQGIKGTLEMKLLGRYPHREPPLK